MQKDFIIALDQGTTSSRAIIYNKKAQPLFSRNREFTQYYPKPGWVEHDAEELFDSQLAVLKEIIELAAQDNKCSVEELTQRIATLGITNQRESVVLWEKSSGKPVYHAIVWQCRRTSAICDKLIAAQKTDFFRDKTGLIIDAYFSATKIAWLLENVDGLRQRAENGEILAGTIDTWLIWKLSGGKAHVTDVTNASRTMLFNIHTLEWDDEILKLLNIPRCILPEVKDSSEVYCTTSKAVCGFEVPVASAIGDQQSALFGQGCFDEGSAKNTYGTGCFLLLNTGTKPVLSKHNLLTTIALGLNGKVTYALEGSVFMGGAVIKWLRDEVELISTAHECDMLAESVPDANGAFLVPAFTGLASPYWDMYARGTLIGLTRGVKKAHICRAALEGIAFQVKDVIDCMIKDLGKPLESLKVDGGACVSDVMMQFQSDLLKTSVIRPQNVETTALGAAFLAGLAVGFWKNTDELKACWKAQKIFEPSMSDEKRERCCLGWKKAVSRALDWEEAKQ